MPCGWEGSRRSGVALAMRHRLQWFIHLRAHGLRKGDEHPAYTPHGLWHSSCTVPAEASLCHVLSADVTRHCSCIADSAPDCSRTLNNVTNTPQQGRVSTTLRAIQQAAQYVSRHEVARGHCDSRPRHCCMSHSDELPSANALSALQHYLSGTLSLSPFRTVTS